MAITSIGGPSNDVLIGGPGNDVLLGNGGNDTAYGHGGNDFIDGGSGNDRLFGEAGNDTLNGGSGNDMLDGGTGSDKMSGGSGNDVYVVDSTRDHVTEGYNQGIDEVRSGIALTTAFDNVENYTFTGAATVHFTGNGLANTISGTSAGDSIRGGDGNDAIYGRDGDDAIHLYESAREGQYVNAPDLLLGLARARFFNGDWAIAGELLDALGAAHPDYYRQDVAILKARSVDACGDHAAALRTLEGILERSVGLEARYRYAEILWRNGEPDRARVELERVLEHAQRFKVSAAEKQWAKLSRRTLAAIG